MRVLTDFHHHALAESLELTLGDRLGMEVYFPYGMDWFDRWYWSFERAVHGDAVARQYLEGVWAGASPVIANDGWDDLAVVRDDPRHPGRVNKGVSLDYALSQRWDLVISSLPHNYDGFHRLAQETGTRYGIQIGNDVQPWDDRADFALASSTLPGFGPEWIGRHFEYQGTPTVMYHQEFSLETFRPGPSENRAIASFVNCFGEGPSYPDFLALARVNPEFDWRVYGALGTAKPDEFQAGDLGTTPAVADAMRAARIGWHSKHWSDGFGHVIHNWGAIGRPVIGYAEYYVNKLAAPLWVDGVTTWDIGARSNEELIRIIRRLIEDDDFHLATCAAMAARFREVVDYSHEADLIADLLGVAVAA